MTRNNILLGIIAALIVLSLLYIKIYDNKKNISADPLHKFDYILIEKAKRVMTVYNNGNLIKTYKIVLGPNSVGHKYQKGDGKTPEGEYRITYKNRKSRYHLSLKLSYPNIQDQEHAKMKNIDPGDYIMIHGIGIAGEFAPLKKYYSTRDWTEGCVAVTNVEIQEIYYAVEIGTKVKIVP